MLMTPDSEPQQDSPATISTASVDSIKHTATKGTASAPAAAAASLMTDEAPAQHEWSPPPPPLPPQPPSPAMPVVSRNNDYTALVRGAYYFQPAERSTGDRYVDQPPLAMQLASGFTTGVDSVTTTRQSSTFSMSDMFDNFADVSASTATSGSPLAGETSNGEGNNGTDRMEGQITREPSMRHGTPPLTVYSSAAAASSHSGVPLTHSPLDPFAMYGPGGLGGVISPAATITSIDQSSGRYTPTSLLLAAHEGTKIPIFADTMDTDLQVGSVSTANSSVTRPASLTPKPLLYSAIGSLEQFNQNSLTKLNDRLLAPMRDFCKPNGGTVVQQVLLPPLAAAQQSSNRSSLVAPRSNTASLGYGSETEEAAAFPTPGTTVDKSEERKEKQFGGEQVFGVFKRHSTLNVSNRNSAVRPQQPVETKPLTSLLRSNKTGAATTDDLEGRSNRGPKPSTNKVSYASTVPATKKKKKKKRGTKEPVEMFRPSSDAFTPRIEKKRIQYKSAEARPQVPHQGMGTLDRPNFRDALRRVAMIIHQHVVKIETRFDGQSETRLADDKGLFRASMRDLFNEDSYRTPTYKCTMTRIPMAQPGMVYGLRKIKVKYTIPSETEIYEFAHQLFKSVQLSSECSIVCLIYVERLMEVAKVPLLACTWRPIFMCGLLLASKVWQDISSWNAEFSSVYPQFSLEAINRLELNYLRNLRWDLYISSSLYAKYYFALRSLVEKIDFRQRYNRMVGGVDNVAQSEALKVQKRTEQIKEEALMQISRSM